MISNTQSIRYCLYARKSSESDERQAMSIDSQIKEMKQLAEREKFEIREIRQESHSAKESSQRPVFNQLLLDIQSGLFNGILTWAPDRLSRNAGDLGRLVDFMDQEKLAQIKTYSQTFSNNPNEKFLLMILCSQAKLENDNRGINVKRGLRAKCEMGWRPGVAPPAYINVMRNERIEEIAFDPERAPIIREIFLRVANKGHSGRTIKRWLDMVGFRTKNNKQMPLSVIFTILKNSFYYGEFEFNGEWYKGKHSPLITKEIFDKVQKQLITPPREWHKKVFPFKTLCRCGTCNGRVTAEEKYKKLKYGGYTKYIYYHCTKSIDYDCDEPYITEQDLIQQLAAHIDDIEFNMNLASKKLIEDIDKFHRLRERVLRQEYIEGNLNQFNQLDYPDKNAITNSMIKAYILHVLKVGTSEERQGILGVIKTKFILHNRELRIK
ncbi:MAG: recombinase family protein [Candidatus Levybacteria bacterium]|nr:recombinase family protein [Candidatus Levybacteria bacterium]